MVLHFGYIATKQSRNPIHAQEARCFPLDGDGDTLRTHVSSQRVLGTHRWAGSDEPAFLLLVCFRPARHGGRCWVRLTSSSSRCAGRAVSHRSTVSAPPISIDALTSWMTFTAFLKADTGMQPHAIHLKTKAVSAALAGAEPLAAWAARAYCHTLSVVPKSVNGRAQLQSCGGVVLRAAMASVAASLPGSCMK